MVLTVQCTYVDEAHAVATDDSELLKGVCREIFTPIFYDLNPSGHLINRIKYFRILIDFAEIFEFLKSSAVCIILRSQNQNI